MIRKKSHNLFVVFLLFYCFFILHPTLSAAEKLIITHVNVIDTAGGSVKKNRTVVIQNGRILSADTTLSEADRKEKIVDGTGKFLIPGLWDMHVHWYSEKYLPLFIANGVTGIRQMFGRGMLLKWRDERTGDPLVPREIVGSPIVDGEGSKWPGTWIVHDSDEARTVVDRARNEKYDFVKIYNLIPRDAYFEIAKRSREIGLPFCGHVPYSVSILEATNAGQKSMEHLYGVLEGCSSKEMDLKKERTRLSKGIVFNNETLEALRKINQQELDTFDLKRANQLFKAFAKNRVYHCPTLTVNRAMAFEDEMKSANDPFLAYMPIGVREFWKRTAKLREKVSSADFKMDKAIYQKEVSLIPLMKQAGVKFLAGTDVLNIYCYPGFSLPNELVLLVKAGLTPLEALQAATVNAAEYMGNQNFGTIENGKTADLDLLDANPLEDIANVKRISAVIFKGKLLEKQDLDRMLSGMKKMSESPEPRD